VVPPHNPETWPGCLEQAQAEHAAWCEAMAEVVAVRTPGELGIATDDSWVRDFGPLFVWETLEGDTEKVRQPRDSHPSALENLAITPTPGALHPPAPPQASPRTPAPNGQPQLVVHDFRFNAWGNKYESQLRDDVVTSQLAEALGLPCYRHEYVLEGGALETDGRGTLLTTTDCLLSPTRNGPADRETIEQRLHETLGITRTLWLTTPPGGLPGDDTDGHIDNAARFVNGDTVALHPAIDDTPLREAGLNVLRLPGVEPIFYDYPADNTGPSRRAQLPASYANFLIANGRVFVPTFGQPSDDLALRLLDDAMPDHTPVPIRANHLLVGQGALHCLSMQQPAQPERG